MSELPGTLWINRGRWNWRVKLPGTPARKNYPLRLPGQEIAIPEAKGRSLATELAWRMWEKGESGSADEASGTTLDAVCGYFLDWADTYYKRSDGSPTREADNCRIALRSLRSIHGRKPIDDITYQNILDARKSLVDAGHNRTTINQRVGVWKRFFAWSLENRRCTAQTKSEVWAITNLKRNRSPAPEGDQVRPVEHSTVKKTIPFLPPTVRAMVLVQELTGARPGEVCMMQSADIEQRRDVWLYRPKTHKTEHRGKPRIIVIGPRAQKVLAPFMSRSGFLFSPAAAMQERRIEDRLARKTKPTPSEKFRTRKAQPGRAPGEMYRSDIYGKAIVYAVKAARQASVEVEDWNPNQLRHACGTRVRRKFGPDAARAVLGHAGNDATRVTDIYTREAIEREIITIASRPMMAIG